MKKVKSLNGYSIFEAGPRDVDKYGYEAGAFYVFFSSDIRDFGVSNSYPEYEGLDTFEAAEACCLGNYAKAREIVENRATAANFEEIEEVEKLLDAGLIDEDGELIEAEDFEADLIPAEACIPAPTRPIFAAGIQNSVVVQGNTAQTIIVNVGEGRALTEEEDELIRIFRSLRVRGRTKLLSFAYALEEQQLGDLAPIFAGLLAGSREEAPAWN